MTNDRCRTTIRVNGKRATWLDFGFGGCQGVAVVLLFGVLFLYISARFQFEPGEEYLPVTITYTASKEYTETYYEDGKERTRQRYDNSYQYIVDGVRYNGTIEKVSYGMLPGMQETRYYNPEDPNDLSEWQSIRDMMRQARGVIWAAVIFESLAVFFKVISVNKKRALSGQKKAYEESVRQDIQLNRETYQGLDFRISRERLFSELEPMRKRIDKLQRAIQGIRKREALGIRGIIAIPLYIIQAIDAARLPKLKNRLETERSVFDREYKMHIAEPILQHLFEEYQYRPSQGFSVSEIVSFQLIRTDLRNVESEDYIEGVYHGIRYRQADVKREASLRDTELMALENGLQGRIAVYDFNKQLSGEVVIVTRNNSIVEKAGMEKVSMENLQFNEMFDVYATDPHTVFYLLTPQFMEYLMDLKLWGDAIFRFADQKLFMLRNLVGGIFEPDMGRRLDIEYEIGKSYNELKEVLDVIDVLKLEEPETEAEQEEAFRDPWEKVSAEGPAPEPKSMSGFRLKLE